MKRRSLYGTVFSENRIRHDTRIDIENGRFSRVEHGADPSETSERFDGIIAPGFVDLHLHGGAGHDFSDANEQGARSICSLHLRHGSTSIAPTIVSSTSEATLEAIRTIQRVSRSPESTVRAIHLEGPYIARTKCGAHDPELLRNPDPPEVESWIRAAEPLPIRITIAPELPGAIDLITRFLSRRVSFSIGHTEADWETTLEGVARGASSFTHLFNAMSPIHHRRPGPVAAAFYSPDTTLELIADGDHVHTSMLHLTAQLAGHRTALVTDAMRATGRGDGTWKLGPVDVVVEAGIARTPGGSLAGSLLTMDRAVRNMVERAGVPLDDVLPMASSIPGAALGSAAPKGRIRPGDPADLVLISPELSIEKVIFGGDDVS